MGIEDNFFELGGHSILAMQVAAQTHEAFHIEIDLTKIFENPTIATIAALIDATKMEQDILLNNKDNDSEEDDEELVI